MNSANEKESAFAGFFLRKRRCLLHPHSRNGGAGATILLVRDEKNNRRDADEQVDEILNPDHEPRMRFTTFQLPLK